MHWDLQDMCCWYPTWLKFFIWILLVISIYSVAKAIAHVYRLYLVKKEIRRTFSQSDYRRRMLGGETNCYRRDGKYEKTGYLLVRIIFGGLWDIFNNNPGHLTEAPKTEEPPAAETGPQAKGAETSRRYDLMRRYITAKTGEILVEEHYRFLFMAAVSACCCLLLPFFAVREVVLLLKISGETSLKVLVNDIMSNYFLDVLMYMGVSNILLCLWIFLNGKKNTHRLENDVIRLELLVMRERNFSEQVGDSA
ncbi:MAG: hypothetical protein GY765_40995 [bacterium]|nr:hypothetical protein [bacterium]